MSNEKEKRNTFKSIASIGRCTDIYTYIEVLPSLCFGVQPALKRKLKFIYLFMRFAT